MRRRLDLAASLVGRPEVIFLDEPTTGLDLPSRQAMWQVITGLADAGVTIFLTTQYLEEADQLADPGRRARRRPDRRRRHARPPSRSRSAAQRLDLVLASAADYDEVARGSGDRAVRHERAAPDPRRRHRRERPAGAGAA